jgi:CO/xanthine dehydrogenase Mo-binding subunit
MSTYRWPGRRPARGRRRWRQPETISVGAPDYHAPALGGKAAGEIGICGVAPAIGNAVFHATGKQIRDLPFTLDKLIREA